jgi:hypothetical protein
MASRYLELANAFGPKMARTILSLHDETGYLQGWARGWLIEFVLHQRIVKSSYI